MDFKKLHVKSKFLVTKDELTVDADELKEVAGTPTDTKITALANQAIQADKDIISQIKVEYNEDNDTSRIIFPKGIMPIQLWDNLLKTYWYFNYEGENIITANGIELYCHLTYNSYGKNDVIIIDDLEGDYTNTTLDELIYIMYTGTLDIPSYTNWYNVLHYVGTKLYKHNIVDNNFDYAFELITPSPTPLNFTTLDNYEKVYNYLRTINVISFKEENYHDILFYYSSVDRYFYSIVYNGNELGYTIYDDWDLGATTDTVTEL